MDYNIKIGEYGKDIVLLSRKVFTSVLNAMPQESIKFEYKNYINYYYLNVFNLQNNKVKYNIIVDVPVFEDNYERIALKCLKFLVDNKINFSMKFYKKLKNSFFKICFEDLSQLKMFVNYFGKGEEFVSETKSRVLPFLNSINLLGIYTEIYPFSFKNYFIFQLYLYFNHCDINNIVDRISLDDFHSYIRNKLKIEKVLSQAKDEYYDIVKELANYAPKTYNTAQAYGWAENMLSKMDIGKKLVGVMRDFGEDYHDMKNRGMSYTEGVNRLNEARELMKEKDAIVNKFIDTFVNI